MELFAALFGKIKLGNDSKPEGKVKTSDDYHREALVKQGREQFQKLVDKGLGVPVALL